MKSLLFSLILLSAATSAPAQVNCPQGFIQISEGGYCESLPGCPPGFALDNEDPICITPPSDQKKCPDNSIYQTDKDRCESSAICPEGSRLDATTDKCLIGK